MSVPASEASIPSARYLLQVAGIVTILGVLPFLTDVAVGWKVIGLLVALAFAGHAIVLLARHLFTEQPGFAPRL